MTPILMDALVQKLHGWNSLQTDHQMVDALKREDLRSWFDGLNLELQNDFTRIIRYVLLIFQDTGIDHSNEHLVVAWPRSINPFGCFKISCKKINFWARMLADSGHCATFAYVTPLYLETDECNCQNQETALWKSTSAVLHTAVSLFVDSGWMPTVSSESWALRHEGSYLIGKLAMFLLVKAANSTSLITVHDRARLYISTSKIPVRFQRRVRDRIREKQCTNTRAQQVLVSAKH